MRRRQGVLGWLLALGTAASLRGVFIAIDRCSSLASLQGYVMPLAFFAAIPFIRSFAKWGFRWQLADGPKSKPSPYEADAVLEVAEKGKARQGDGGIPVRATMRGTVRPHGRIDQKRVS